MYSQMHISQKSHTEVKVKGSSKRKPFAHNSQRMLDNEPKTLVHVWRQVRVA